MQATLSTSLLLSSFLICNGFRPDLHAVSELLNDEPEHAESESSFVDPEMPDHVRWLEMEANCVARNAGRQEMKGFLNSSVFDSDAGCWEKWLEMAWFASHVYDHKNTKGWHKIVQFNRHDESLHAGGVKHEHGVPVATLSTQEAGDGSNDVICTLAFAGTVNSWQDIIADLHGNTRDWCGFHGVHAGFAAAIEDFVQSEGYSRHVKGFLHQCSHIVVTGHSLGAAKAQLFAACANTLSRRDGTLDERFSGITVDEVYTFGSPALTLPGERSNNVLYNGEAKGGPRTGIFHGARLFNWDNEHSCDPVPALGELMVGFLGITPTRHGILGAAANGPLHFIHPKIDAVRLGRDGSQEYFGKREGTLDQPYGCLHRTWAKGTSVKKWSQVIGATNLMSLHSMNGYLARLGVPEEVIRSDTGCVESGSMPQLVGPNELISSSASSEAKRSMHTMLIKPGRHMKKWEDEPPSADYCREPEID